MTALVLTPQPATASVLIQITGAPAGPVVITRTDANGSGPVRLRTGQEPIAGALTLIDYEPALIGGLTYDVVDSANVTTTGSTALDGTAAPTPGAEVRRNRCTNPSFEVDTSGWTATGADRTRDATRAAAGSNSLKAVLNTAATGPLSWLAYYMATGLTVGTTYTFSFDVWCPAGAGAFVPVVRVSGLVSGTSTTTEGKWVRLVVTFTATSTVHNMGLSTNTATPLGTTYWVDRVLLEVGATAGDYFDGDTLDTEDALYSWLGAAGASASIASVAVHYPAVTAPQIGGVQLPGLAFDPELVTGYEARREASSTVHQVVGRSDPVVVLGPTRLRSGRLDVWCRTHADALECAHVLAQARMLMFRQADHPGLDMYFLATTVDTTPLESTAAGWFWQTSCEFLELRNPSMPLLGAAGWTFDDVAATYPTFAAVRAAFPDFDALLVGA